MYYLQIENEYQALYQQILVDKVRDGCSLVSGADIKRAGAVGFHKKCFTNMLGATWIEIRESGLDADVRMITGTMNGTKHYCVARRIKCQIASLQNRSAQDLA